MAEQDLERQARLEEIRKRSRRRRVAFYGAVVAVLIAIQTAIPHFLIEAVIGAGTADDVEDALRDSTEGIFLALLVTLYFDVVRQRFAEEELNHAGSAASSEVVAAVDELRKAVAASRQQTLDDAYGRLTGRELARAALAKHYGNGARLDALVDTVLPDVTPHKQVIVSFTLDGTGHAGDRYRLTTKVSMAASGFEEYAAAFLTDARLANALSSVCQDINDIWLFTDRAAMEEGLRAAHEDPETLMLEYPISRGGHSESLTLEMVSEAERGHYLGALAKEAYASGAVLVRARFPSAGEARLSLKISSVMRRSDGFVFWRAERPTLLTRVEFDCSRFGLPAGMDFSVQPFFRVGGGAQRPTVERPRSVLDLNEWVLRGEGVALVWRERPAE